MAKINIGKEGETFKIGEDGTIIRIDRPTNQSPKNSDPSPKKSNSRMWVIILLIITSIVAVYVYDQTQHSYSGDYQNNYNVVSCGDVKFIDANGYYEPEVAANSISSKNNYEETDIAPKEEVVHGNYKVIVSQANIYDYYGTNESDAYFDKKPEGSYYPYGTTLFIEYEFNGYGYITYPNEQEETVRGFIKLSDLQKD